MLSLTFAVVLSITLVSCNDYRPIVVTQSGAMEGLVEESTDGYLFYGFKGIPYAKPPTGPLRFKPSVPFGNWDGIRDGSIDGNVCPQMDIVTKQYIGQEDCLYLNVYVPKSYNCLNGDLNVMVYIHGGGFVFGSGNFRDQGPQMIMNHELIVVTVNYRLGALGYLSTEDNIASGNYGLWDQNLASEWVRDNIRHFGGNKDKVTLVGHSAGSASVLYHMISDNSKGLFSRAIPMSGTPISFWAFQYKPKEVATAYAAGLNCNVSTSQTIIGCLNGKTALELVANTKQQFPLEFLPSIDVNGLGFIIKHPLDSLRRGEVANKVDTIMGHTRSEGYIIYLIMSILIPPGMNGSEYFETLFPQQMSTIFTIDPDNIKAIDAIKDKYYRSENKNVDDPVVFREVLQTIAGEATFHAHTAYTIELLTEAGLRVYPYIYDHIGEYCFGQFFGGQCGLYCSHADEVFVLFKYLFDYTLNAYDNLISKVIVKLYVDFIQRCDKIIINSHGDVWPYFSSNNPKYIIIDEDPPITNGYVSNDTDFWTKTVFENVDGSLRFYRPINSDSSPNKSLFL